MPWTAFFKKDEARQLALIVSETGRMNVKPLSNGLIPQEGFSDDEFWHEACDSAKKIIYNGPLSPAINMGISF